MRDLERLDEALQLPKMGGPMTTTKCAACGLPAHRFGRNEGMERFDSMACINMLRGELENPVAAVRRGVEDGTIGGEVVEADGVDGMGFMQITVDGPGPFLVIPVDGGES